MGKFIIVNAKQNQDLIKWISEGAKKISKELIFTAFEKTSIGNSIRRSEIFNKLAINLEKLIERFAFFVYNLSN